MRLPRIWLPARPVPVGHADLAGPLARPRRRPAASPQNLRIHHSAGGLLHPARHAHHPLVVPLLGGRRNAHRAARPGAVRPQSAGSARPGPRLLRILYRRAHHRLHQPLDDLRRPGNVRPADDHRVSVLRLHRPQARLALAAVRFADGHRVAAGLHPQHLVGQRRRRNLPALVLEARCWPWRCRWPCC